ncbi:unnamed protein product [Effrenium voratum]|uniref:Uncharacterized protein n=1 Tax=Effrenium voratum TaxID=2562239 RepID=A0AA36IS70_9DINO|nr:unnamed protein product [Effrenium voratum]
MFTDFCVNLQTGQDGPQSPRTVQRLEAWRRETSPIGSSGNVPAGSEVSTRDVRAGMSPERAMPPGSRSSTSPAVPVNFAMVPPPAQHAPPASLENHHGVYKNIVGRRYVPQDFSRAIRFEDGSTYVASSKASSAKSPHATSPFRQTFMETPGGSGKQDIE